MLQDHMRILGYLGPLSEQWLKENKVVGCPHPHITSGMSERKELQTPLCRVATLILT